MSKLTVDMLSMATSVEGQGVGSAYTELINLLQEHGSEDFEVIINKSARHSNLIHVHTVEPVNYAKLKLSKKPTVCYVHFLPDTLEGSIDIPKPFFSFYKKYIISLYKAADHLVVVNPTFIKEMVKFGLDEKKITYIPNFVSKKRFFKQDAQQAAATRAEYGFKPDDFVVLGCGQVQTRKGVADFIKTAELLPDVKFIWAGGFSFGAITDGYNELKRMVDNPPPNVSFPGIIPREKMNDLFNAVDLLFMPSYNELFPMTILEAVSTETPVLLRDIELYEDILFHKYVCADSNEDFARLIEKFKTDPAFYEEQTENARFISDYYSEERIYGIWKQFYNDCVNEEEEEDKAEKRAEKKAEKKAERAEKKAARAEKKAAKSSEKASKKSNSAPDSKGEE